MRIKPFFNRELRSGPVKEPYYNPEIPLNYENYPLLKPGVLKSESGFPSNIAPYQTNKFIIEKFVTAFRQPGWLTDTDTSEVNGEIYKGTIHVPDLTDEARSQIMEISNSSEEDIRQFVEKFLKVTEDSGFNHHVEKLMVARAFEHIVGQYPDFSFFRGADFSPMYRYSGVDFSPGFLNIALSFATKVKRNKPVLVEYPLKYILNDFLVRRAIDLDTEGDWWRGSVEIDFKLLDNQHHPGITVYRLPEDDEELQAVITDFDKRGIQITN